MKYVLLYRVLLSSSCCKELYNLGKVSEIMVGEIRRTQTRMWLEMGEKNTDREKVANGWIVEPYKFHQIAYEIFAFIVYIHIRIS